MLGGAVKINGKQTYRLEDLLVERAVGEILRAVRGAAGNDDIPVDRLRAGEVSTNELAELLSPSLFADERVVILEDADEAGKDAAALIASAAADLPPGTVLVVVHSGGGQAKALRIANRKMKLEKAVLAASAPGDADAGDSDGGGGGKYKKQAKAPRMTTNKMKVGTHYYANANVKGRKRRSRQAGAQAE